MRHNVPRYWVILLLLLLFAGLFMDSQERIVCTEYNVHSEKLPDEFDGYRIIQLSDLHGREFGRNNRRLIDRVVNLQPDLIAITGDILDSPEDLEIVDSLLSQLCAIAPCCYVTGNHEWATGCVKEITACIAKHGGTVLDNNHRLAVKDNRSILLAGVVDPNGPADWKRPDAYVEELRRMYPDHFLLLLGHRNYWAEEYADLPVDLILCGHAHGGLIRLPILGGLIGTDLRLFPKYTEGLIPLQHGSMLISRGLGNSAPSFRLFNNPEIVVVNLKKI